VAFYSKTINSAECNYPIYNKKLLVIVRSFQEWKPLLMFFRTPFEVYTDHQALQYFAIKRILNSRQAA
jgi:hypothetical protein